MKYFEKIFVQIKKNKEQFANLEYFTGKPPDCGAKPFSVATKTVDWQ